MDSKMKKSDAQTAVFLWQIVRHALVCAVAVMVIEGQATVTEAARVIPLSTRQAQGGQEKPLENSGSQAKGRGTDQCCLSEDGEGSYTYVIEGRPYGHAIITNIDEQADLKATNDGMYSGQGSWHHSLFGVEMGSGTLVVTVDPRTWDISRTYYTNGVVVGSDSFSPIPDPVPDSVDVYQVQGNGSYVAYSRSYLYKPAECNVFEYKMTGTYEEGGGPVTPVSLEGTSEINIDLNGANDEGCCSGCGTQCTAPKDAGIDSVN